ncbi:MAG: hypothetical protein KatS3mg027_1538 [Bacteroidia bacterium]|nr:MAG: hypothetical protein KatS3mg027_1538 [Bacteroidia bacterium]
MNNILILIMLILTELLNAQLQYGKVVYERRTNLLKRFSKIQWLKEWIEEDQSIKIKTETFELYFNDTMSVFLPKEDNKMTWMQWATSSNKVYTNFKKQERITFKDIFGEIFVLKDSIPVRKWKYTGKKRKIAGYECLQLVWPENDSSRIYAWIAISIPASVGPESFSGLPGAVLGLATEDGGIVYFAKSVEFTKPSEKIFRIPKYKKTQSTQQLFNYLKSQNRKSKWDELTIQLNFGGIN